MLRWVAAPFLIGRTWINRVQVCHCLYPCLCHVLKRNHLFFSNNNLTRHLEIRKIWLIRISGNLWFYMIWQALKGLWTETKSWIAEGSQFQEGERWRVQICFGEAVNNHRVPKTGDNTHWTTSPLEDMKLSSPSSIFVGIADPLWHLQLSSFLFSLGRSQITLYFSFSLSESSLHGKHEGPYHGLSWVKSTKSGLMLVFFSLLRHCDFIQPVWENFEKLVLMLWWNVSENTVVLYCFKWNQMKRYFVAMATHHVPFGWAEC